MIRVDRGATPSSIARNEASWKLLLAAARASGDKSRISAAESRYRQPDIKYSLEKAFNGKCAYCEQEISSVSYAHIEHYRPKSRYPSRAFSWSNLLLSCPRCNDAEHKGDKFPLPPDNGPIVDPCSEDPSAFFNFIYDVQSKLALIRPTHPRGVETEKIFELNKRKGLIQKRSRIIRYLICIKLNEASDPDARAIIAEAKLPHSEFSAWAKALL